MTDRATTPEAPMFPDFARELVAIAAVRDAAVRKPSAPRRFVLAAAAALLTAFIALTPPGQAIAERIGDLVGIGDPPTIDRGPSSDAPVRATQEPIVIGIGKTPSGVDYQMVAFRGENPALPPPGALPPSGGDAPPAYAEDGPGPVCFAIDYPGVERTFGTSRCAGIPFAGAISQPGFNEARNAGPDTAIQLETSTGPDTASVAVTYENEDGRRVDAQVAFGRLDEELAASIDVDTPMGYAIAFLPKSLFPDYDAPAMGSLQLTAYDDAGDVIGELDYGPRYERVHESTVEAECLTSMIEREKARAEATGETPAIDLERFRRACELRE